MKSPEQLEEMSDKGSIEIFLVSEAVLS